MVGKFGKITQEMYDAEFVKRCMLYCKIKLKQLQAFQYYALCCPKTHGIKKTQKKRFLHPCLHRSKPLTSSIRGERKGKRIFCKYYEYPKYLCLLNIPVLFDI